MGTAGRSRCPPARSRGAPCRTPGSPGSSARARLGCLCGCCVQWGARWAGAPRAVTKAGHYRCHRGTIWDTTAGRRDRAQGAPGAGSPRGVQGLGLLGRGRGRGAMFRGVGKLRHGQGRDVGQEMPRVQQQSCSPAVLPPGPGDLSPSLPSRHPTPRSWVLAVRVGSSLHSPLGPLPLRVGSSPQQRGTHPLRTLLITHLSQGDEGTGTLPQPLGGLDPPVLGRRQWRLQRQAPSASGGAQPLPSGPALVAAEGVTQEPPQGASLPSPPQPDSGQAAHPGRCGHRLHRGQGTADSLSCQLVPSTGELEPCSAGRGRWEQQLLPGCHQGSGHPPTGHHEADLSSSPGCAGSPWTNCAGRTGAWGPDVPTWGAGRV